MEIKKENLTIVVASEEIKTLLPQSSIDDFVESTINKLSSEYSVKPYGVNFNYYQTDPPGVSVGVATAFSENDPVIMMVGTYDETKAFNEAITGEIKKPKTPKMRAEERRKKKRKK